MSASSARHGSVVSGLAALVAVGLVAVPAAAQQHSSGAPVSLAPPPSLSQPGTRSPASPDAVPPGAAAAGDAAVTEVPSAPDSGIRVDTLRALDPGSVGLLDTASGGFGVAMWQGTPRALVERLLPHVQPAAQSATAQSLFRRLLLSAAVPPAGPGLEGGPSLLALRVGRLLDQGDVASARALLRLVPSRVEDGAIARARAEVAFLTNDNAGACAEVRAQLGQSPDVFWRKAQVFCQLLEGDSVGAGIGAGLLREQGVQDSAFFGLVRALSGESDAGSDGLDRPEPLHLAMMRAAQMQIPPAVAVKGAPQVLRMVAASPNADIETRLAAAERAEARGALDTEALRRLYLSVEFPRDDLAGAITAAENLSPARGRALLYRAMRSQTVPAVQAEIVARAFALARRQGNLAAAVRVFLPAVRGIEASPDLSWFAVDAASALYLGGAYEAADAWYRLAKSDPAASGPRSGGDAPPAMPADVALWPLAAVAALPHPSKPAPAMGALPGTAGATTVISGASVTVIPVAETRAAMPEDAGNSFDGAMFDRWWKAAAVLGDAVRLERAGRLLAVLEALGAEIGENAWARLVTAPTESRHLPPVAVTASLKRAAAAGRVGETVLLALIALGPEAPGAADPRRIAPVVRALAEVGLAEDARGLTMEAVFGGGV